MLLIDKVSYTKINFDKMLQYENVQYKMGLIQND